MTKRELPDFLFLFRGLPGFFRKFKLWILAALFLLILLALGPILGPVVELLTSAVKAIGRILLPVLDNPVGRFILVNLLVAVIIFVFYRRFRARGRALLGSWAMDRFLAGLLHLSSARYRRAARSFEHVLRLGRWVDLKQGVAVYPEILADARIKLSLCYREMGEVAKAMKSLELLKVGDLSPAMKREHAEAKAFVYSLSDKLMDETIDREIVSALERDSGNRRLLTLQRDRAARLGDLEVAIRAQKRILKGAPSAHRPKERSALGALHARNALRLHQQGKEAEAMSEVARSRSHDPNLVLPNLLAGDLALERGDARAAVKEWARTPSLAALERIEKLMESGAFSSDQDMSFLVGCVPRAGVLLSMARHYLQVGKPRRARNCVRKYEELGLGNRHSALLLSAILRAQGDESGAEQQEWRALKGFLGAEGSPTSD